MCKGDRYGTHRVLEPAGVLPQPAWKLDNRMEIYDNEILVDVQTLNIDSASFTQLEKEADGDVEKIKAQMLEIVRERGKHHNPVTGSGGMLIGTIEKIGEKLQDKETEIGDRIASLVSLSLTPLRIDEISEVRPETEMASILAARDGGRIYFFSMATSFTRAALGAEGVGKDVEMIIGNGYARGHDRVSLEILRENKQLRDIFTRLYT